MECRSKMECFMGTLFCLLLLSSFSAAKQEPCLTCFNLVSSFVQGILRTSRHNFGGGNTAWEKEKLSKYDTSETRLVEVIETACAQADFDCNNMLEQNEELLEAWWFKKPRDPDQLFKWLCMDKLRVCCPPGTYGSDCKVCPGGAEKPCYGHGKCDGSGTRLGNGLCDCYPSYGGEFCNECAVGYYEKVRNETHLVCSECHKTCSKCRGSKDFHCVQCKKGYVMHEMKCIDIDECGTQDRCKSNQYCVNTEGSYECRECDKACIGCMGAGSFRCKKCNAGYTWDGPRCVDIDECDSEVPKCKGSHEECVNTEGSYSCACEKDYIRVDGMCKSNINKVESCGAGSGSSLTCDVNDLN
ncbi:protein disulfide isomerase CRELD1 isoform X2 [Hyperolius riggenbachi]|uniref:protein disulfide isomerase CRELD1 isoform X2 n=1 Tax=Hyperolius riggenbachi TaxID=752182 RepID=UPI0035A2709C